MVRLSVGPRLFAALLGGAGLLLTMAADPPRVGPPVTKGEYQVLAADLHVHSFPGDGALPAWELAVEARRRHLDAIALTNHNSTQSWRFAEWLAPLTRRPGAMLIPGEEVTAAGYHLAAVGVTSTIDWRQTAASAAAAIHERGGVAIAAHPSRRTWRFLDDAALAALDGVEVAHPMIFESADARHDLKALYDRAPRVHPGIAAIGSSDFHEFAPLGLGRTYLFVTAGTQTGILDAIRSGRTVACDGRGEAYGPPRFVALVRDDCRRDATSPPAGETGSERAGTWMVWLGVVALVVLGADEAPPR